MCRVGLKLLKCGEGGKSPSLLAEEQMRAFERQLKKRRVSWASSSGEEETKQMQAFC